jgi:hypothetical protein
MKVMSSKEIKEKYGLFTEAARREPVVHTVHGRSTLVTISIDRARRIPELRNELGFPSDAEKNERLARFLALGGSGVRSDAPQTTEDLAGRSRFFRGDDE